MGVSLLNLVAKGKTALDFVLFSAARRRSVIVHEDLINRIFMQLHVFQTIFDQPKPLYMYKNDLKLCTEKAPAEICEHIFYKAIMKKYIQNIS